MKILVTGASGNLGSQLVRYVTRAGHDAIAWSGSRTGQIGAVPLRPVDLCDPLAVRDALRDAAPDAVIHAAAIASIDRARREPAAARAINAEATAFLASQCRDLTFVFVSSDLVFDGESAPYRENDEPSPLSLYGITKREAESAVLAEAAPRSVVVRASLLFGSVPGGRRNFHDDLIESLRTGRPVRLFADEWRTPLGLEAAAAAVAEIALRPPQARILHVGGPERMSRYQMGLRVAEALGVDPSPLLRASRLEDDSPEPRPRDTSLDCSLWRQLYPDVPWPALEESVTGSAS